MTEKRINKHHFYWNPETKEKLFIEYLDGTKIKLNEGQLEKATEARKACIRQSLKEVKDDFNMRRKPLEKRGRKPKEEPVKVEPILKK